jgi:hypothetical protein
VVEVPTPLRLRALNCYARHRQATGQNGGGYEQINPDSLKSPLLHPNFSM